MAKRSQCCAVCRELNVRQHRFVLLVAGGMAASPAYVEAGYEVSAPSAESLASRLLRNVRVARSLDWHQGKGTLAAVNQREAQIARLLGHVNAELGDFMTIGPGDFDRKRAIELLESELGDAEVQKTLRKMLWGVKFKDWDELPPTLRQSIQSVKQLANGAIEFKLEPKRGHERLLADLHGWKAEDEIRERVATKLEELVGLVQEVLGVAAAAQLAEAWGERAGLIEGEVNR